MGIVTLQGIDAHGIVRLLFTGVMTAEDLAAHLHALVNWDLFILPTIIDSRSAIYSLAPAEAHRLSSLVVDLRRTHGYGFTAQVADVSVTFGLLRMHNITAESDDPGFAVFRTMEAAEAWMLRQIHAGATQCLHAHE